MSVTIIIQQTVLRCSDCLYADASPHSFVCAELDKRISNPMGGIDAECPFHDPEYVGGGI